MGSSLKKTKSKPKLTSTDRLRIHKRNSKHDNDTFNYNFFRSKYVGKVFTKNDFMDRSKFDIDEIQMSLCGYETSRLIEKCTALVWHDDDLTAMLILEKTDQTNKSQIFIEIYHINDKKFILNYTELINGDCFILNVNNDYIFTFANWINMEEKINYILENIF